MDNTVNAAAEQVATAEQSFESASDFAFAPEPARQQPTQQETNNAGQKGAGAVDAQRSADARGNEPRKDFAPNRFQKPQKDIGKAFAMQGDQIRTKAEREYSEKLANDPYRRVANLMVSDLMQSDGLTEEQAIKKIEDGFYASISERDGLPVGVARMIYAQQQQQQNASQQRPQAQQSNQNQFEQQTEPSDPAYAVLEELASIDLPEGFDVEAAGEDIEFARLLTKFPAEAAVQMYHLQQQLAAAQQAAENAPQQVADQLRSRAAVPQSSRSSATAGPPDYHGMTRDQFRQHQRDNHLI